MPGWQARSGSLDTCAASDRTRGWGVAAISAQDDQFGSCASSALIQSVHRAYAPKQQLLRLFPRK